MGTVSIMKKKDNSFLNHANHNAEVCEHLYKKTEYHDWIVTTAFYSSIYYCDYKIFPFETIIEGKNYTFTNLDNYHQFYNILHRQDKISKHLLRSILVKEKIEVISSNFNKLWNLSKTARYYNYDVDKDFSKLAFDVLERIKKECI